MCTAVTYKRKDFYFGRTLDNPFSYGEELVVTPRNFPFCFREAESLKSHYAMLGMAHVAGDTPLYYDAVNECGLCMAGLNFVGNAVYGKAEAERDNIAHFELIAWLLGQCASVREAKERLSKLQITDTPFSKELPPAQLHWILADRNEAITVEAMRDGLHVYENPAGVLTNNPPFQEQMFRLNDYRHLSPCTPENRFAEDVPLSVYCQGLGAVGLPGDWTSTARFARAVFIKSHATSADSEEASVSQFFHILGAVSMPRGCVKTENDGYEITIYTACCNADKGIYYYTTYDNPQINGVDMHKENLDGSILARYPLKLQMQLSMQNK